MICINISLCMQEETLKINYEEMLEKDNNMDLEIWYESKAFSEKKEA